MNKKKTAARVPPELLEWIASRFKLLAEPARLRILHSLGEKEKNVGEIIADTGLEQANVSKHLALLLQHGIVGRKRSGLYAYYSIADPTVFRLCEAVCRGLERKSTETSRTLTAFRNSGVWRSL